jgi:hypothetical protein
METKVSSVHREPWNKDKIVGQKAPFKVKDIWALRVAFRHRIASVSSPCSTSESTASCEAAIWSR